MADEFTPWTRKYSPKKGADLEGIDTPYSEMRKFIEGFKPGKGLILHGGTGAGKTSSVYALAHDLGLELIEANASDSRNAAEIDAVIGNASNQASLFFTGKIILVDEIEGIAGREDRGGVQALVKIIEASRFPIVMTCQDAYNDKIKPLKKISALIEFKARSQAESISLLRRVCGAEKLVFEEDALKIIANKAAGDLRAAINDLQSIAAASSRVMREDIQHLSDRERKENIAGALLKVFKTTDYKVALGAYDLLDEDLDEIFLWVDENLPREYLKPTDLARGFEALSAADVFKGRIMRWQHYRFYVHCYELLSAGIALAKDERYKSIADYKQTSRKLKIWMANQKNLKKKAIAEKIAEKTHTSKRHAFTSTLPYVQAIFRNDKAQAKKISLFLDLDGEQEEYLSS